MGFDVFGTLLEGDWFLVGAALFVEEFGVGAEVFDVHFLMKRIVKLKFTKMHRQKINI